MFRDDDDTGRADWPLLRDGAVNLFHRREVLEAAQADLAALDYEIAVIACDAGEEAFRAQMSALLRWEEQFGYPVWTGNLDALNDGMRGYPFGPKARAALILDGFHAITERNADAARIILDIIERTARDGLLWGRTLVALVRTDDPHFECPGLGGRAANWNPKEWGRSA